MQRQRELTRSNSSRLKQERPPGKTKAPPTTRQPDNPTRQPDNLFRQPQPDNQQPDRQSIDRQRECRFNPGFFLLFLTNTTMYEDYAPHTSLQYLHNCTTARACRSGRNDLGRVEVKYFVDYHRRRRYFYLYLFILVGVTAGLDSRGLVQQYEYEYSSTCSRMASYLLVEYEYTI